MRDTLDGLKPRILREADWVISINGDARSTAPVITRRGFGLLFGSSRAACGCHRNFLSDFHSTEI